MTKYFKQLCAAMAWLGKQDDTIFLGQGVVDGGHFMFETLQDVPLHKRVEYPVTEQLQMGASIGWAIAGYRCISIFPRHNFLLLAMSELVNLLDKLPELATGYMPKVIIRTALGTTEPIYPGIQHTGHFTEGFQKLLKNVNVIELKKAEDIEPAYTHAYHTNGATLITEFGDCYHEK